MITLVLKNHLPPLSNTPELSAISSPPSSAPELETNENTDDTDDYDAGPEAPDPTLKDVKVVIEDYPDSITTEVETETEHEIIATQPEEKTVEVPEDLKAVETVPDVSSKLVKETSPEPAPEPAPETVEESAEETVPQVIDESLPETTPVTTVNIPGGFTEQPEINEISVPSTSESAISPNTASSSGSPNNPSSQGFRNIFSLSKFLTSFDWFFKYIILFKVFGIKSSSNIKKDQNKRNATTTTTTSTTAANN
ncbi:unnamed protein product [[Candida] boidinii]|uniref:Unnamed protein product n=1 Tax=Candida boidinii TaxID=5477 RepID=A0A9W6WKK5_CANBO|nr:unnamed protein product [[Candida] boidinii]